MIVCLMGEAGDGQAGSWFGFQWGLVRGRNSEGVLTKHFIRARGRLVGFWGLGFYVMEAVEHRMDYFDMHSLTTSLHKGKSAGTEETENNNLDCSNNPDETENQKDKDASACDVPRKCRRPYSVDGAESADTDTAQDRADSRSLEISDDNGDHSTKDDSNDWESDDDSSGEGSCLEAMTPSGHQHYLRLGDTPRRRSALRLSRIIARKQLLRKLARGREREIESCGLEGGAVWDLIWPELLGNLLEKKTTRKLDKYSCVMKFAVFTQERSVSASHFLFNFILDVWSWPRPLKCVACEWTQSTSYLVFYLEA